MINFWSKCNGVEKDLIARRFDLLLFCTGGLHRVFKWRSILLIARLLSQLIKIIRFVDFILIAPITSTLSLNKEHRKGITFTYFVPVFNPV